MIHRITITGTESTGKSVLAEALADYYQTAFVPDISRQYIAGLTSAYTAADVVTIAEEIIAAEDNISSNANRILFSDNDLINIKIWLQYYQWQVPQWLENEILQRKSPLYLLCDIDLPWMPDAQRQNPHDRTQLLEQFKNELEAIQCNYHIVSGQGDIRIAAARSITDAFISSLK